MRWLIAGVTLVWGCSGAAEPAPDVAALPTPTAMAVATAAADGQPATTSSAATSVEVPAAAPAPVEPLTEERIRETVRSHYDRIGACYAAGLERDPSLQGTIEIHLSIDDDGRVVAAFADKQASAPAGARKRPAKARTRDDDPRITDPEVVGCVEKVFTSLAFPPSGRGLVNLVYPVVLRTE